MTRTATTKLVATALAVASLGMASTAQAEEAPATATGGTPPVVEQAPAPAPQTEEQAPVEEAPATEPSQEELDKQRYERYCHMKDAEPSHNDKKFCEDNKGRFEPGTGGKTSSTGHGRKCNENGTREYCYEKENHKYEDPSYEKTGYEKPVYEAKKAMGKELPFTGLEIWQLGLIGIVLSGGGIGARRMLAS